jgi:hypothetical protein
VPSRHNDAPDAATIAIAALSHFATDPKTLNRFFALTGLDPDNLRDVAGSPEFVAGVLDFVLQDDTVVLAVAEAQEIPPEAIAEARRRLDRPAASVGEDWPPRTTDDVA